VSLYGDASSASAAALVVVAIAAVVVGDMDVRAIILLSDMELLLPLVDAMGGKVVFQHSDTSPLPLTPVLRLFAIVLLIVGLKNISSDTNPR
jgi:hypothetical protein